MASCKKSVVFIFGRAGSMSESGTLPHHVRGGSYIFRSSKATLNSIARNLAFDLAPEGVAVLALHPVWVKTDASGVQADIEPQESVQKMRTVISNLSTNTTRTFKNYDGQTIHW